MTFEHAALAFRDPFAVDWVDRRHPYGEERIAMLARPDATIPHVVYTERQETIRIISARKATRHEQNHDDRQNAP